MLAGNWRARPSCQRGSWIEPDVAATPAAPPPATPDGAASAIVVSISMMAAVSTHRYIVFNRRSEHPAPHIPAHLDLLLHVGSRATTLRAHSSGYRTTRDAELGRGISHLQTPRMARMCTTVVCGCCLAFLPGYPHPVFLTGPARRWLGYDVQYFAAVEPQWRLARTSTSPYAAPSRAPSCAELRRVLADSGHAKRLLREICGR